MENKILHLFTQNINFNNKYHNVIIKSYEHPFKSTSDGSVKLYSRVDIYDGPAHWGYLYFDHEIETEKQANAIFEAVALYPERYKSPNSDIEIRTE